MELRHLIYFKTVAEHLHFRNAANALFISATTIEQADKRNWRTSWARACLYETIKGVALTDAGNFFY